MDEEDLQRFLDAKGIDAEIIRLRRKTKTVEQAAVALQTSKDKIIKTLTFIDGTGEPVLAIVTGKDAVDPKKLAKAIDTIGVRMATPAEVKRHSGYSVGGVPPVGHVRKIRTVIDVKVMRKKFVYGGGGSDSSLLRIKPWDIKRLQDAMVKSIT
ncbi:MAG: aminoacyl-tRNA deacylase [Candidatus Bathyarchaeia archaeon]